MAKLIYLQERCYVDTDQAVFMRNGFPFSLTPIELRLLQSLASNQGHIIVYKELLDEARIYQPSMTYHELHVYMCRLRKKIDSDLYNRPIIVAIKGVGYILLSKDHFI